MKKKEESFFKLITQKPWEASQAILDNDHEGKTLAVSKAKLGVRTIMVVSTVIFSLFVISYSDRMLIHDWRSLSEPWLLWINTVILIFTSIIFHRTKVLSEQNEFLNNQFIDREDIFLFNSNDPVNLRDCVLEIKDSPATLRRVAAAGQAKTTALHTASQRVAKIVELHAPELSLM